MQTGSVLKDFYQTLKKGNFSFLIPISVYHVIFKYFKL